MSAQIEFPQMAAGSLVESCVGAHFSEDRLYRHQLWRTWDYRVKPLNVIGLNPSTADERVDDPTIRRCIGYAKHWGRGGLIMTNLFDYRATEPRDLKMYPYPVSNDNSKWIMDAAEKSSMILCAWGKDGKYLNQDERIIALLWPQFELRCLGLNKDQTPKHPLYQRADTKPGIFNVWDDGGQSGG